MARLIERMVAFADRVSAWGARVLRGRGVRIVWLALGSIAALVRPSAMRPSTSRSRGDRRSSGSRRRVRASSCATTSGSRAVPPVPTRSTPSRNSDTSAMRSLSR